MDAIVNIVNVKKSIVNVLVQVLHVINFVNVKIVKIVSTNKSLNRSNKNASSNLKENNKTK